MRLLLKFGFLVLLAGASSCMTRKSAVWIKPGSTLQRLTLGVARERGGSEPVRQLFYVAVKTCYTSGVTQQTFWEARGEVSNTDKPPTQIAYGAPPRGFSNQVHARVLLPGCYEWTVIGEGISGTARFTVTSQGAILEDRQLLPTG